MTNYEHIKQMNIEEIAILLDNFHLDCTNCPACDFCNENFKDEKCSNILKKWLKNEAYGKRISKILFRGKRIDNGKWVEGGIYYQKSDDVKEEAIYIIGGSLNDVGSAYEVIPETVGQYTGRKDENGERVFEGDIFECYVDDDDNFGYSQTSSILAVVVWDEKHFCYGMKVDDEIQDFSDWDWENSFLIGNITDNPELLKGELE